jgi:two-component system KDP operon response regulator KdpE
MKKIVVVDDSSTVTSIYRNKLLLEGFEVHVAADGQAALFTISQVKPDLVLLDLGLPKMSGIEVLRRLRGNPSFQKLPVIILSGALSSDLVTQVWQAGATQLLMKSLRTPKEVVEAVRRALAETPIRSAEEAPVQ